MTAQPMQAPEPDDRAAKRNVGCLAIAQAIGGSTAAIVVSTGGLVGYAMADDKALATVPVTCFILGTALSTLPANLIMQALGRRGGYVLGSLIGVSAGLFAAFAIYIGSFWAFSGAMLATGFYWAFVQSYRFAAADAASEAFKPKAISWVMAGGVVAAVVGPQTVIATKDLFAPFLFMGTFLAAAGLAAIVLPVVAFLRIPRPQRVVLAQGARPLGEIARQPRFVAAALCGAVSYATMSLVMTASPLAMVGHGLSLTDAALGIQWHALAMYVPSFFTGALIGRFGKIRIVGAGLVFLGLSALLALNGVGLAHFWAALVLLGIGWNFGFIGATALLTDCYRVGERNKVQGANDFLVFGLNAIASFSSGIVLAQFGWGAVNLIVFPGIFVCIAALVWLAGRGPERVNAGA